MLRSMDPKRRYILNMIDKGKAKPHVNAINIIYTALIGFALSFISGVGQSSVNLFWVNGFLNLSNINPNKYEINIVIITTIINGIIQ